MTSHEMTERYKLYNRRLFSKLSIFLNAVPDFIEESIINELCTECGLTTEEAYSFVLASAIGLDTENSEDDRRIFEEYFPSMLHLLDTREFEADRYLCTVRPKEGRLGTWELRYETYKPYEAFVCGDPIELSRGRIVPQLGFFERELRYPAILENGREWMLVTPNEIVTMREPIRRSHGRVLTFGLGLGYFAFMTAEREEVESVTVVERDESVIELFRRLLLPLFPKASREKLVIVRDDAFEYAKHRMREGGFDVVFADIWHDPSDGVEAYKRLKSLESELPDAEFLYWIEQTLQLYM